MISFVHDGPSVLGQHFNADRMNNLLSNVQLLFVGARGKVGDLERKALTTQALDLRYYVLYNHLAIRQALGHVQDVPLPSPAEIAALIQSSKVDNA